MKIKRGLSLGLLSGFLSIFLLNLVSAQFYSGFGRFSITGFLDSIGPEDLTLMALFIIFFAVLFYAFGKFFKDTYGQPNRGIAGPVAFAGALLIVYFGFYRTGFDLTSFFYGFGIDSGLLYPILSIIFLALAVFIIWKLGFRGFLMLFGLFLILLVSFTDIFYEEGLVLTLGFVLLLVGLFLFWRKRKKKLSNPNNLPGSLPPAYNLPAQPSSPPQQQIVYQQRQRSIYDLQQKYDAYKFNIFRTNLTPHQRQQMLKAMYIIEDYLRKLGARPKGQSPKDIEKTLKKNRLI